MFVVVRHGDPLDIFDDEERNGVEGVGPEEEEFYPESSQWEAEEEEVAVKEIKPPPYRAPVITEKVT